jgi:hypothetical protein
MSQPVKIAAVKVLPAADRALIDAALAKRPANATQQ